MKSFLSGKLGIDKLLAFLFGVIFLLALLIIAILIESPSDSQQRIFRAILALASGGIGAVIPGLLNIKMESGKHFSLRAAGALALFVIVYLLSPAL